MASIEAQIQLILKGSSEIDKLQKKLDSIEDTAASIQDQFERGLFGRSSNLQTYMNALSQIGKAASAVRDQTREIQSSNSEIKRTILLESQLRRERSRTARLSRAFEAETKGLDQTRGKLKEVKEQFDAISSALGQAFKLKDVQIVSQLRNELSALVEDQREWNRALAGTKNTGVNADLLKEQSAEYARQISLLRERAEALGSNEALIRKLNAAERNLVKGRTKEGTFLGFADPRLGREQLKNAKALIQEEERLAEIRKRSAAEYENQQKQARREIQQTIRTIGGLAQKATGATFDALTFGKGPQIAKGFKNAAIRGGVGLGALGLGGAYAAVQQATGNIDLGMLQGPATQAASAIGGAINNALGGVPAVVAEMLSALGNIPGSLGLASVAALAFAPAMKTAGEAVFLAGKKFGESKFGENIKLTLDRQTNLFESVINKASEMNMVLDASRSGLDAVGRKIQTLPALPAAGQTAFTGPMRRGRGGAFIGGGAREITNPEFLATAAGTMAQRTQEAAQTSLMFAEGLGQAANEAKTIAEYLKQANELRAQGESSTQRFIRQAIERGRIAQQGKTSADIARERSALLTGSSYSLAQVPAGGELFPGGRTETAAPQYREMLNTAAKVSQLQQEILESMSKQQGFAATIGQLERRTVNDKGRSLQIQQEENSELQRSIQIIRERNRELRQRPISAMTPQERVSGGILDPSSLRASRRRRVEQGRAHQESIRRAVSEGLIGGAFPLLFGQGVGAAVGGAAGGFGGGFAGGGFGFGLSLVGTALGTAFDTAVQSAQELGRALEKPVENFDQLAQQSFFSSKALEDTIKKTIEYGDTATASALIQEEAIKKLGVGGVQNLKVLGTESDRLNRAFAELGQQMQAVAAGPLASVIGFFANIAGQAAAAGRVRLLRSNLDEQQAGQFNQEILQRLQQQGIQRGFFAPSAPTDAEIGMLLERGALQDIVDKWQAIEVKGKVKLDPKQKIESEINALQKQLEAMDIGKSLLDQVRSANREQEDLDKQRADLVRSYEESIGNIRKQVEDEIRNKRFAILEKENQLLDAQGQIRLKQLQIANQAAIAQAGVGQRPEVEQAAKEVAQLVAQFTEQQVSAEEEAASIKRNAALEVQKIDSEAAQFKANIEKEVSRLNIETARRVADINEQVRRRNEENDSRRFNIERDIAVLRLKLVQDELALATRNTELPLEARQEAFKLYKEVEKRRKETEALSAPRGLRGVGAVGGGGVSTAGLDRAAADYRTAVENYVAAQLRLNELDVVKNAQEFALGVAEFANKTDATLTAIQTREADAEIERLRYIELVNAGLTDTVAQKVIELETTKRVALAVYDTAIAQLENKIIAGQVTAEVDAQNRAYLDQIKILKQRKDALEGKFGEVDTATGKGTGAIGGAIESEPGKKIQGFIAQATAELNDLESVAIRVSQGIGDAVGNSIANGISGLIEGTATAKEVFAGFLKDVGDILIKEGTRMIAMYAAIALAKRLAGLFGGGGNMGGANYFDPKTGLGVAGPNFGLANGGAFDKNGMYAFANGGMFTNSVVSSPTLFQFADGGTLRTGVMGEAGPEAIMPLERGADGKLGVRAKLDGAMARYRRPPGADAAAEPGSPEPGAAGGGTAAAAPIDVRYTVERINSVDYVTADQFQAGMRQAATQGAQRGEQATLRRLQQSRSTRSRLGLS